MSQVKAYMSLSFGMQQREESFCPSGVKLWLNAWTCAGWALVAHHRCYEPVYLGAKR